MKLTSNKKSPSKLSSKNTTKSHVSVVRQQSRVPNKGLKALKQSRSSLSTSGLIDDVMGGIQDAVNLGGKIVDVVENPFKIVDLPNSIMKVVDVGKNIVKDLTNTNLPKDPKVVLDKSVEITASNEKVIQELKKSMPIINTTSVPSAYNNQISMPPPVEKTTMEKGRPITNLSGSVCFALSNFPVTTAAFTNVRVTGSGAFGLNQQLITPGVSGGGCFGSRANTLAQLFQRWRLNAITIQYINLCPLSTQGSVFIIFNNETAGNVGSLTSLAAFSQYEHKETGNVGGKVALSMRIKNPWLWTINSSVEEAKWYAQWYFALYTVANGSSSSGNDVPQGQWWCTFDIDFAEATPQASSLTAENDLFQLWLLHGRRGISYDIYVRSLAKILLTEIEDDAEDGHTLLFGSEGKLIAGKIFKDTSLDQLEVCRAKVHTEDTVEQVIQSLYFKYRPVMSLFLDGDLITVKEIVTRLVGQVVRQLDERKQFRFIDDFA